jgi:hypothetical protein
MVVARRRARRRRRIYAGVGFLIALAGAAVFTILDRTAPSQTASPALASRSGSTLAPTVAGSTAWRPDMGWA